MTSSAENKILNTTEPPQQQSASSARDDWLCAICMDYLNDAVQTSCSHKFCRFCIDRWITVNPTRQCPICRSSIGRIVDLAELNAVILTFLSSSLTPEEIEQRQRAQQERARSRSRSLPRTRLQRNPRSALHEASSATSLENALVQRAIDNSLLAAERNLHFRHQRWPTLRGSITSTYPVTASTRRSTAQSEGSGPTFPHQRNNANNRPGLETDEQMQRNLDSTRRNLEETRRTLLQILEREHLDPHRSHSQASSASQNFLEEESETIPRGGRETLFRNVIEDVLINEYNYHLRRVESAFARMQEAKRNLNFHSGEMRAIYENFVTHQEERQNNLGSEYQSSRPRLNRTLREPPRLNIRIVPNEAEILETLNNARNSVTFSMSRTPTAVYDDAPSEEEQVYFPIHLHITESRPINPVVMSSDEDEDEDAPANRLPALRLSDIVESEVGRPFSFASVQPLSEPDHSQTSDWESIASSFRLGDGNGGRTSSTHAYSEVPVRQRFNRCRRSSSFRRRSFHSHPQRTRINRRVSETSFNELTTPSISTIEGSEEGPLEARAMSQPSNASSNIPSIARSRSFNYDGPISPVCVSENGMNIFDVLNNNFEVEEARRRREVDD